MWLILSAKVRSYFVFFWALVAFGFSLSVKAAPPRTNSQNANSVSNLGSLPSLSLEELRTGLVHGLERVDEFVFIKKRAKEIGIKVYLFGGTASAFAHYVKWDLLRLKGDTRFHQSRFDYRYINIYRSTQDLDIVVDGPTSAIATLQSDLSEQFPYLQGSKAEKKAWEVRSLRENVGDKLALLNNPDFLNQHTDSNSVGLVEITDPLHPEERIRDLKEWDNLQNSGFVSDLLEGKIHFYFSDKHHTTKFFMEGRNPPILAVIRYFIKVLQLDLEMRPEDEPLLRRIIEEFDPTSIASHNYLPKWFADNGPKLIQNSIDVEKAFNLLERVGLRAKLKLIGNPNVHGSLSWWMNKEPLKTYPLGTVPPGTFPVPEKGPTAAKLGLDIIAHETTSFLVYEAITRSHQGLPNILISRPNHPGEAAAYGPGYYAMVGERSGFRGTGFTIRAHLDPAAVSGIDFTLHGKFIVIKNRAAIRIISENISMDLIEYYNWLKATESLSADDLGIFHRLRLAMRSRFLAPNEREREFLHSISSTDLILLFEKDPSIEGRKLLLSTILEVSNSAKDLLSIFKIVHEEHLARRSVDTEQLKEMIWNQRQEEILKQFLALNPTLDDLQVALKLGLFHDREELYLKNSIMHLHSLNDIREFLRDWHTMVLNQKPKSPPNIPLNELGLKFFRLSPSEQDASVFLRLFSTKSIALGLAAYQFEDPRIFLLGLTLALEDPTQNAVALKVWRKQKARFFELHPNEKELTDFLPNLPLSEIRLDILNYVAHDLRPRRREDFIKLIQALGEPDKLSKENERVWKASMTTLESTLLSLKPELSEIVTFYKPKYFTAVERREAFEKIRHLIKTENDLKTLVTESHDYPTVNQYLLDHQDEIKRIPLSWNGADQLTKYLKAHQSANLILSAYAEQNPNDHKGILDLIHANISDLPEHRLNIESAWIRAFKAIGKSQISHERLLSYRSSIPSAPAYRVFLTIALQKARSISTFLQTLKGASGEILPHFDLQQQNAYWQANNEIIPKVLRDRLPELTRVGGKPTIADYLTITSQLRDRSAVVQTLDALLKTGFSYTSDSFAKGLFIRNSLSYDLQQSSPEDVVSINGHLTMYLLINRNEFSPDQQFFTYETYSNLITFFSTNAPPEFFKLENASDVTLAIVEHYLLFGIKTLLTRSFLSAPADTLADHLISFLRLVRYDEKSDFLPSIKILTKKILASYSVFVSVAAQRGMQLNNFQTGRKLSPTTEESFNQFLKQIDSDLQATNTIIDQFLNSHPELMREMKLSLNPPSSCQKSLEP